MLFTKTKPATFEAWYDDPNGRRYKRTRGNNQYQAIPADSGNYNSLGQLVGTNKSISAKAWESYTGRTPTANDMRAITDADARQFYKSQFWDKIQGDHILSQRIANLVADSKSSGGGVAATQRALGLQQDGNFGNATLTALNMAIMQNEPRIYNAIRDEMIKYYTSLNNPNFSKKWIDALNEDYPPARASSPIWLVVLGVIFVILIYKTVAK